MLRPNQQICVWSQTPYWLLLWVRHSDNSESFSLIKINMQQKHNFYMKSEVKWKSKYLKINTESTFFHFTTAEFRIFRLRSLGWKCFKHKEHWILSFSVFQNSWPHIASCNLLHCHIYLHVPWIKIRTNLNFFPISLQLSVS